MLAKSRAAGAVLGLAQAEFREGLAEALPVPGGWADVVISADVEQTGLQMEEARVPPRQ
jgi:hypothetical protein